MRLHMYVQIEFIWTPHTCSTPSLNFYAKHTWQMKLILILMLQATIIMQYKPFLNTELC